MSRSVQYIGLNKKALNFLKKCKASQINMIVNNDYWDSLPLTEWQIELNKKEYIVREIIQTTPWSSGPMIFTCLELDFNNGGKAEIFQWIDNPLIKDEFNYESGEYWV